MDYSVHEPPNALSMVQYNTNHKMKFVVSINATCFGTGVPFSGCLIKQRTTSTWIGVLDLCPFVLLDCLKMAPLCRNMYA